MLTRIKSNDNIYKHAVIAEVPELELVIGYTVDKDSRKINHRTTFDVDGIEYISAPKVTADLINEFTVRFYSSDSAPDAVLEKVQSEVESAWAI